MKKTRTIHLAGPSWPRSLTPDSFTIFRRFGTVHSRVLLHLQCEITSLEKQLEKLDWEDSLTPGMLWRLKRNECYEGWDPAQKDLMEKLKQKLMEYRMSSVGYGNASCLLVIWR